MSSTAQFPKQSSREIAYRVGITVSICLSVLTFLLYLRPWGSDIFLLIIFILIISTLIFWRKVQKLEQARRDDFASIIFDHVQAGNIETFAVFLRPFYVTGKLKVEFVVASGQGSVQTYVYQLEETK